MGCSVIWALFDTKAIIGVVNSEALDGDNIGIELPSLGFRV